ncbi:MAG: hypothetical protein ACRDK9_10010 [Solirubrobacterales bacterium]
MEGFFRELSEAEADGSIGPAVYERLSRKYGIAWLDPSADAADS